MSLLNQFLSRNSLFVGTVFAGAFIFETKFDDAVTAWYENHNKGKLWKDVKGRFVENDNDDE